MRLVRSSRRENINLSNIESPFFAKVDVRNALYDPYGLHGLLDLIQELDSSPRTCQQPYHSDRILNAIERGDWLMVKNTPFHPLSEDWCDKYPHITGKGRAWGTHVFQPSAPEPLERAKNQPVVKQPQEPGFYVVPKSVDAERLAAQLFTETNAAVTQKFKALNPNLGQVKAGQMIVLSDPNNLQCTREEAELMATAERVNKALEHLTPGEADFMHPSSLQSENSSWLNSTPICPNSHETALAYPTTRTSRVLWEYPVAAWFTVGPMQALQDKSQAMPHTSKALPRQPNTSNMAAGSEQRSAAELPT